MSLFGDLFKNKFPGCTTVFYLVAISLFILNLLIDPADRLFGFFALGFVTL